MDFLRKFLMGGRVTKTSIAAGIALYLASFLNFSGYTYAAMIAILATQKSLSRSLGLARYQITSAIIGTLFGNLLAWKFSANPLLVGIIVYFLFALHLRLGWRDTILISIVTCINSLWSFTGELVLHFVKQLLVVLIGIACSILVNLFAAPRYEEKLGVLIAKAEGMLRGLLYLMYYNLDQPEERLTREEFVEQVQGVQKYIKEAHDYAGLIFEDQWIYNRNGNEAKKAIEDLQQMERLSILILNMVNGLGKIQMRAESIPLVQKFLEVVIHVQMRLFAGRSVPFQLIDRAIANLDNRLDELRLPENRLEFITRAALYHFYSELKDYYQSLKIIGERGPVPRRSIGPTHE